MEPNKEVSFLITKAGLIVGSEYKLAKEMGIPQTVLTDWKAGRRTCTPADRARLAGFAQEDAIQELVRATIESAKGVKREQLQRVLGKLWRQTGAVLNSAAAVTLTLTFGLMIGDVPRCILC